ncbi:hypothetical protein M513_07837 [Trichuris suis]|uniref:Uncharacterized protein n=1 Tax=Trichuris suis TaxID=68888 RepID=A0A085M1Z1_9BILA|nr:hypothetical protein M513_07837 [Trichuris suis]
MASALGGGTPGRDAEKMGMLWFWIKLAKCYHVHHSRPPSCERHYDSDKYRKRKVYTKNVRRVCGAVQNIYNVCNAECM